MPRKMLAKRAAAYHACVELRKAEYLDEYLLPQYIEKQIPTMANARLAIDISKKHAYEIQRKPSFWKIEDGAPPTQLWLTIFVLEKPHNIREGLPLQPIGMMTRKKLPPKMAPFTLYGDRGLRSDVRLVLLNVPMTITKETLALLDEFTTRVFGDVFNKIFEYSYETQPYWIVPLVNNMVFAEDNTTEECLDWETLRIVFKSNEMEWDASTPGTDFLDRFLVDKVARSRRFAVIEWAKHLGPNDPIPAGSGTAPDSNTIREYSYNEGKKKRMVLPVEADVIEPVFAANRVLHRINYLVPPNEREFSTKLEAHIIPTPFKVTELKMPLVRSLVCFPAMSWKIDAYLQAYDVCTLMDVQMDLKLALEAITKDSDNTHEHDAEAVNQQGGMGTNYERLEFLGDCYLKLGTSISLFCLDPRDDEFHLHVSRMELICNQNLFKNARDINLPRHIQTQGFGRRGWYPAMKLLHGKGSGQGKPKPVERHNLGDKSIADVCEALIGAALVDKGLDGATKMTTNILRADTHTAKEWKDYYKAYTKPDYQTAAPTAQQERLADNIAKQFGYKFKSPRLLMSAFCHPSNPFTYERVPSYQRLEFLGDSLLDLTCVQYIFNNNPTADPQWMTEHKMAMVSNKFLCAVSVELGLHRRLRACGPQIDARICEYALELEEVKSASEGRVDYWVKIESKPPKELADMLEAFIGALFVDTEFDFDIVQHFFDSYIKPYFLDMSLYDDFAGQHPTTFLTKELTRRGCMNWGYEKKNYRDGDNNYVLYGVMIHNEVFEHVVGEAIKDAKVEVSMKALKRLEQMRDVEFEDICDCKQVAEEGGMGDFDWDALLDEEGGDQEEKEE